MKRLPVWLTLAAIFAVLAWALSAGNGNTVADDTRDRVAVRAALSAREARATIKHSVEVRTRYRTVRDTLLVRLPADTQPVPRVQVDSLIASADAMEATCAEMEVRCAAALAAADTLQRFHVQQIGAERRKGRKRALLSGLVGVAVGVVAWEVIR